MRESRAHGQGVFFANGQALLDLPHRQHSHIGHPRHLLPRQVKMAHIGTKGRARYGSLVITHCAASFSIGVGSFPACSNACAKALVASCSPTSVTSCS